MVEPRPSRLDQPREPRRLRLPRLDPEAFGRWSETIARFMGTGRFIVYMTVVIAVWLAWNTLAPPAWRFDPYTFTFLTLILSLQASYAAPLILLAQNRLADRDRLAFEEDRRRAAAQKADVEYLSREIAGLRIALGEVATRDFIRSELGRLMEELNEPVPAAEGRREALHRRHRPERAQRGGPEVGRGAPGAGRGGPEAGRGAPGAGRGGPGARREGPQAGQGGPGQVAVPDDRRRRGGRGARPRPGTGTNTDPGLTGGRLDEPQNDDMDTDREP